MPIYIKDDTVNALAVRYQTAIGASSKTEAVRVALQEALDRIHNKTPLMDQMREVQWMADRIGKVDKTIDPKGLSDEIWDSIRSLNPDAEDPQRPD